MNQSSSVCIGLSTSGSIGIISDTHGLIRAEAIAALQGSSAIIHAGDIGNEAVLRSLGEIAPVYAVRGNNDIGEWAQAIPSSIVLTLNDVSILVMHDLHDLNRTVAADTARAVITGHSHRPSIREQGGILYINPGSAGPRRFALPISVATLRVQGQKMSAKILTLACSPTSTSLRSALR